MTAAHVGSPEPCDVTLIPYSRWGNPVGGGMRVWIPEADA